MDRFTSITSSSSSSSSSSSYCQSVQDAAVRHAAVAATSAVYTIIVIASYYLCLRRRLEGALPSSMVRQGQFWIGASVPKLAVAIALFTVLLPVGTSNCPFDSGPYYIYPSVSVVLCARWIVRGVLLIRAGLAAASRGSLPVERDDNDPDGAYDESQLVQVVGASKPKNASAARSPSSRGEAGAGELV